MSGGRPIPHAVWDDGAGGCRPAPQGQSMTNLVGVAEIASRLGVRPSTVTVWTTRHADFPPPLVRLAMGPVWDWAAVERWASRERRPGPRPKV